MMALKNSMRKFLINPEILIATEMRGFNIVNPIDGTSIFMHYPEAAVWSILSRNLDNEKSYLMLMAIMDKSKEMTLEFISTCLREWAVLKLIR